MAEEGHFLTEVTRGLVFLLPMAHDGLRGALTRPLEAAGYRFENEAMVGTSSTGSSGPGDAIALDEVEFPQAALHEAIPMNPGSHVVRIQRAAALLATRTVTLASGAAEAVHIELPVKSPDLVIHKASDPPAVAGTAVPVTHVDHGSSHTWLRSPWLWSGVALVVVGSAAGAYVLTRPDGVRVQ